MWAASLRETEPSKPPLPFRRVGHHRRFLAQCARSFPHQPASPLMFSYTTVSTILHLCLRHPYCLTYLLCLCCFCLHRPESLPLPLSLLCDPALYRPPIPPVLHKRGSRVSRSSWSGIFVPIWGTLPPFRLGNSPASSWADDVSVWAPETLATVCVPVLG